MTFSFVIFTFFLLLLLWYHTVDDFLSTYSALRQHRMSSHCFGIRYILAVIFEQLQCVNICRMVVRLEWPFYSQNDNHFCQCSKSNHLCQFKKNDRIIPHIWHGKKSDYVQMTKGGMGISFDITKCGQYIHHQVDAVGTVWIRNGVRSQFWIHPFYWVITTKICDFFFTFIQFLCK